MSWYVDEAAFNSVLFGFSNVPPEVVIRALGDIGVCTTIVRRVIPDDEITVQKILAYAAHSS